jgi:hypothetical protein
MFKKILIGGLVASGLVVPISAQAQISRDSIEQVGIMILAERLGIDPGLILSTRQRTNASVYDLAPVFAIQRDVRSHRPEDIWEMRRRGMGWGEIAKEIGMHPGTFNKMRNAGEFDVNHIWRDSVSGGFGLDANTVQRLRNMGLTWQDISTASVLSAESGRSIWQVVDLYRSTRNWSTVASRLGVSQARMNNRVAEWRSSGRVPENWRRVNVTAPPGNANRGSSAGNSGNNRGGNQGSGNQGGNRGRGNGRGG